MSACNTLLEVFCRGTVRVKKEDIKTALRDIVLALSASHNTVTTDLPDAEPTETHWRIDNSKAIALVGELERALLLSTGNDL